MLPNQHSQTAHAILAELLQIHRSHPAQKTTHETHQTTETITTIQFPRIHSFVKANKPIELILPAFPSKSPNPSKVLSRLPDMAERLSLTFLNRLCERIQHYYPPGAKLLICSDGRVFGDLIRVDDHDISAYQTALRNLISTSGSPYLDLYSLDHNNPLPAGTSNFNALRQRLIDEYADPIETVRQQLMDDPAGTLLYRAITRFMFEDGLTPSYRGSRAALQKDSKNRALGVIQRSWAWGALLANRFPDAIRLSIHPQPATSLKIGIHLMPTRDNWLTPWHGVAVEHLGRFTLMKRRDAERLGGRIVMHDQHPSHYRLDPTQRVDRPTLPRCVDENPPSSSHANALAFTSEVP